MPGVRIAGVTSFPCFLYDGEKGAVKPTANAQTVLRCAERLSEELGIPLEQINMPSATCVSTIPMLKELGATHGEPGHALTGTTPLHQQGDQPEVPAMVYVSEVSHKDDGHAYVYGGGFYRRSKVREAIVGKDFAEMPYRRVRVRETPPEYIDYYGILEGGDHGIEVGDTVVCAFRTQIFVTRSQVALVEGIQRGKPSLKAIYDSTGKPVKKGEGK
jgi:predicted amino acid racemase